MKTVCSITLIHGREEITVRTIERLNRQSCTVIPILVGDDSNRGTAERIKGSIFVEMQNRPIYNKTIAGVKKAREFEPDAVLHLGSDDWLSDNWLDSAFKYFDKGNYHVAGSYLWVYNFEDCKDFSLYGTKGLYCDSGEVVHQSLYEHYNWDLLYENNEKTTGLGRKKMFEALGHGRARMDTDLLCINGPWTSYHTMDMFKKIYSGTKIGDGDEWLLEKFPDALKLKGEHWEWEETDGIGKPIHNN